jgi:hypothetical protein
MSERTNRVWHFVMMLPFFLIGVAIPVYFFGFSGDGPPQIELAQRYSPVPPVSSYPPSFAPASPGDPNASPQYAPPTGRQPAPSDGYDPYADEGSSSGIVDLVRGIYETAVDRYISPTMSPLLIRLSVFFTGFLLVYLVVRLVLVMMTGVLGGLVGFLIHKAAAPMFMGFLAVGSTWGIHQTIAEQFGLTWAAATVSVTAAIASLFSLAGVRIR